VERLGDLAGGLTGAYLDGHLSGAGRGVVGRGEEVLDLAIAEPAAGPERGEQDQRHEEREQRPAAPLGRAFPVTAVAAPAVAAPGGGPSMSVPSTLAILLLEREVEVVQHQIRLRCASSQLCRISTAAAWSTTARWRLPRTPRSDSLRAA